MRRALSAIGFIVTLSVAASSFASLLGADDGANSEQREQSFLIPRSATLGADECLASRESCGMSAAASICESRGYSRVISFGEASPEDMTGSIDVAGPKPAPVRNEAGKPYLVTCSR